MTEKQIRQLQKDFGYDKWQGFIENGAVWSLEGMAGRTASQLLEDGVCFLPTMTHKDYWGNTVPARDQLQEGTKGTLENSRSFWRRVVRGEIKMEKDEYFAWM